jgi:hypothetical protein
MSNEEEVLATDGAQMDTDKERKTNRRDLFPSRICAPSVAIDL